MHVYLNPQCGYGKGRRSWRRRESRLRERFGDFSVEEIVSPQQLYRQVGGALREGERHFVAAGGDGTVNLVANALLGTAKHCHAILGAVGLGSSNDFHKPFRKDAMIDGVPIRMDWNKATWNDAIAVRYSNGHGQPLERYCLINASIGITAQANAVYNSRLPMIQFIQRASVEAAILLSALWALATYRDLMCEMVLDDTPPRRVPVTNLGVLKNPHFAGGLCYDTPVATDDGRMCVNLCSGMTRGEIIATLVGLYRSRFKGRPKTSSYQTTRLQISAPRSFSLELDGEVVQARRASFELELHALRCCT